MADAGFLDFGLPLSPDDLVLNGQKGAADLTSAVTSAQVERTMEGPSVLTLGIADETYHLFRGLSVLSKQPFRTTLSIEGLAWTLSEFSKTEDGFTLVFYDAASAALKRMKPKGVALKAGRDKSTRAQFVGQLAQKAGVPYASPDQDVKQPIQGFSKQENKDRRRARRSATDQAGTRDAVANQSKWWKNAHITVKGAPATAQQLRNITIAMETSEAVGAFPEVPRAVKALLIAGIHESTFREDVGDYATGTHVGVWQSNQIPGDQVATQAEYFFKGGRSFGGGGALHLARTTSMSPGAIADAVEVGGIGAAEYDKYGPEADKIMAAWSPGGDAQSLSDLQSLTGTPDQARVRHFEFQVGAHESFWAAGVRLAEEVNWRFFTVNGTVWFASDYTLLKATPSMVISEFANGVDRLLWTFDQTQRLTEMTVTCRLTKWAALPGQAVVVEGEGDPVDGRWLVRSIERDLLDTAGTATVTLGKAEAPKPEPKSSIVVRQGTDPADLGTDGTPAKVGGGSPLVGYPLATHGKDLGGVAAHGARAWGNWQSDNAVDIGVPRGTDVFAVDDGTIVKLGGSWDGTGNSNPNGWNITLKTADNEWFYTHMMERNPAITVGRKVKRGDFFGKSGAANGVNHLHIACEHGDPEQILGVK